MKSRFSLDDKAIKQFQDKIFTWYKDHQRDLPWHKTRDPYSILVSEVMSQQTQLGRVIPKYEAWMKRFPTINQLADASTREVLQYWSGLGYNSRALNLQKTARIIVREFGGEFPQEIKELVELPGIGKYTAAAVACFAFDAQIPVVDTNIRKVILTQFICHCEESRKTTKQPHEKDCHVISLQENQLAMTEKEIEEIAWQILPVGRAYEWNQALMDYSSLVLKQIKIPVPKQSHFLSSDRYFRGQTIKLLIGKKSMTIDELWRYFDTKNPILRDRLEKILNTMQKDGLLHMAGESISLPLD
jgi:A/G-specific adenine glycosylase